MPNYLIRQSSSWCFRLTVPADLRPEVGLTEVRYSLQTGSLRNAKHKAQIIAGKVWELFGKIRRGDTNMDQDQINSIIQGYVQEALEASERHKATRKPLTIDDLDDEARALDYVHSDLKEDLALGRHRVVHGTLDRLLTDNGIKIDRDSEDYQVLARKLLVAQVQVLGMELERMYGNYPAPAITRPSESIVTVAKPPKRSATFGQIVDDYWKETSGSWKESTTVEYTRARDRLLKFIGPKVQVHLIDYARMRDYKAHLMKVMGKKGKPPAAKTINKDLTFTSAVFNWAVRNNHIKENPAKGLRMKESTHRPDEERSAFSQEDLEVMFGGRLLIDTTRRTKRAFYWITLLGLFTGARREELAQLYVRDVQQVDGVWLIDINEDAPDKSVKTSERRVVPLHPVLVDVLGFIDYVQGLKPGGRVFPELVQQYGKYGHAFGNWFISFRKKVGIREGKVFHSFRHTVVTRLLNADVPEYLIAQLVGHSDRSMTTGRYGKRCQPRKMLDDVILKLDFGGLDFGHLKIGTN